MLSADRVLFGHFNYIVGLDQELSSGSVMHRSSLAGILNVTLQDESYIPRGLSPGGLISCFQDVLPFILKIPRRARASQAGKPSTWYVQNVSQNPPLKLSAFQEFFSKRKTRWRQ